MHKNVVGAGRALIDVFDAFELHAEVGVVEAETDEQESVGGQQAVQSFKRGFVICLRFVLSRLRVEPAVAVAGENYL